MMQRKSHYSSFISSSFGMSSSNPAAYSVLGAVQVFEVEEEGAEEEEEEEVSLERNRRRRQVMKKKSAG